MGPALYVAGDLGSAGGIVTSRIARWDGAEWSALTSESTSRTIFVLAVFDDGTGPALYAGGSFSQIGGIFTEGIAKWNGTAWSPVGGGVDGGVRTLTVFDDGSGPALYAGGEFISAGGVPANNIAKWDGTSWSVLGSGVVSGGSITASPVLALAGFDDGTGPALYAGGDFTSAGGVAANRIARWDGTSWSVLGSGVADGPFSRLAVHALAVFDDGTGPALIAGGFFGTAGGVVANHIAKWDGASWSALGSGVSSDANPYASSPIGVRVLTVFDDGMGAVLYAGGAFDSAGAGPSNHIAEWDGASWSALAEGVSTHSNQRPGNSPTESRVEALAVFDDGSGAALYVGGQFQVAGAGAANNIARWNAATWSFVGNDSGLNEPVRALAIFDDGTGAALFAAGDFFSVEGLDTNSIAKWDGAEWSALGSGLQNEEGSIFFPSVRALEVFDDGSGPALYAGGGFLTAGGVQTDNVARWDGTAWSPVGSGLPFNGALAFAVFDDGTGPALYAGASLKLAKWDGISWSVLGDPVNGTIFTLAVYDDGTGPALFAGGSFVNIGGVDGTSVIAKWDGSSWSVVGSGLTGGIVIAMAVFDDGTGPALYVSGASRTTDGMDLDGLGRWDGSTWSPVGNGGGGRPEALSVFDDGTGPALHTGGFLKWDGSSWSPVNGGRVGAEALAVFDDGSGPDLYAGGFFTVSPAGDSFLARWGPANGPVCPGDANADRIIDFSDITSVLGNWLTSGAGGGDADCDQSVDFGDITAILGNWQAPCP